MKIVCNNFRYTGVICVVNDVLILDADATLKN